MLLKLLFYLTGRVLKNMMYFAIGHYGGNLVGKLRTICRLLEDLTIYGCRGNHYELQLTSTSTHGNFTGDRLVGYCATLESQLMDPLGHRGFLVFKVNKV